MDLLKNVEQIETVLNKFTINGKFSCLTLNDFITTIQPDSKLLAITKEIDTSKINEQIVSEYINLIFQLKNPLPSLGNFVKLFLLARDYKICYFAICKTFVNNIGLVHYNSMLCDYTYRERFFDRFIEVVKNCEISADLYIPLVVESINSDSTNVLFNWRRPAIEFMQLFFTKNEEWIKNYLNCADISVKYNILSSVCEFNTSSGIVMLLKDICGKINYNEENCISILKYYKKDVELFFDKFYDTSSNEEKKALVYVLIAFLPDNESTTRLNDKFKHETNDEIKEIIASKLNFTDNLSVKNEKQFLFLTRKKIKQPQERALGIVFDKHNLTFASGLKAKHEHYTLLIDMLKNEKNLDNLKKLYILFDIFEKDSLVEFSNDLFKVISKKDDILFAKWAIRYISLFHSEDLKDIIVPFVISLFNQARIKEASYFIKCLCSNSDDSVILILKGVHKQVLTENKELFADVVVRYASKNMLSVEEINDELVDGEFNESKQIKRLFNAFITSREFSVKSFEKNYLGNPLLLPLAERLVWGEYKFSRLYNTFIIKNAKIEYLCKTSELSDRTIKIVHTLDLDERTDTAIYAISNPLFEQFKRTVFNVKDFSLVANNVNQFKGMFVNVKPFCDYLVENSFRINKSPTDAYFESMIYINQQLEVLVELTFEKPTLITDSFATLDSIYFYKLSNVIFNKSKAITEKTNAMTLGGLPSRFFDYILSIISIAIKNK